MLVVPAKDKSASSSSEVTIDYDASMDIGKIFADRCREKRDESEGIIAIEVLIGLMKSRNIRTVQGLDEMVNDVVKKLQITHESNCSVKSACDIFQHFITMANLDETVSYDELKKMLLDRARMYLKKMRGFRDNIARNTNHLIGSNFKLLTHAKSRNVVHSLSYIVNNAQNPRPIHCYVTQTMPSKSGEIMVKELAKNGVSCTLVPDTALGYIMPEIDAVVLGAEAVVESGGVLNCLGSCSVAMIAHALRKPVYVLVESFKFLRVYPFNQFYIPDELKWKHAKPSKTSSNTEKPKEVEKNAAKSPTSQYDAWVELSNLKSQKFAIEIPNIDYTSPNYITALITDLGILDTSAIYSMGRLFLLLLVMVAHASSAAFTSQGRDRNRLLILFLDGLRYDYFNHLDESGGVGQMRLAGCHVPKVRPVFPSNCFANVHALFAGHDSLHFSDFDVSSELHYTHKDLLWYRAANEGMGVKLFHFPFCNGVIEKGIECIPENRSEATTLQSTLVTALDSLISGSTDLAVVFHDGLDVMGHQYGASLDIMMENDTIASIDAAVLSVVEFIKEHPDERVSFAIVSDHGMTNFTGYTYVDHMFLWRDVKDITNLGAVAGIWPTPGSEEKINTSLRLKPNFDIYTPETLPGEAWPPSELPPFILLAPPGMIFEINYHKRKFLDHFRSENLPAKFAGTHGYLPEVEDMQTTFLAFGPAFSHGCELQNKGNFSTYDVFPVLHKALFSTPPPMKPVPNSLTTTSTPNPVTKYPTTSTSTTTTTTSIHPKPEANIAEASSGMDTKLVVGVIFALFVVIGLIILLLRYFLKVRRHRQVERLYLIDAEFMTAEHFEEEKNKEDLLV